MSDPSSFRILAGVFLVLVLTASNGVEARCECMNKIVLLMKQKDYRVITSPDYPRPYCPKLECIWRLVAPDNTSSIHFFTDNLDLRPNEDFIYFYEGDFSTELRNINVTHSCSEGSICQFKSRGQKATVRFVSGDGFPQNYGFQGTAALYDRTARPQSSLSSVIFLVAAGFLVLLVAILIAYFTCCRGSRYDKTSRPSETTKEEALAEEKLLQ